MVIFQNTNSNNALNHSFPMKLKLMLAVVVVFFGLSLASCAGYDLKKCEELGDKIASGRHLNSEDYVAMVEQLDALLPYADKRLESISNIESMSDRCDELEEFHKSEEYLYILLFNPMPPLARGRAVYEGKARNMYETLDIQSRAREFFRKDEKLNRKCRNYRAYGDDAD